MPADRFGADYYGDHWLGDLAELIIYDRELSVTDRKAVEDYLLVKYRTQGGTSVPVPTITPDGGVFMDAVGVTLSTPTPEAIIRYTLDGSEPNGTAPAYLEPISITKTTTLKAKSYRVGYDPSPTVDRNVPQQRRDDTRAFTGLDLWWRADAGVPTGFGDFWEDQSGQMNHGTQLDGTAVAHLVSGVANGLPAMQFDGGDAMMFRAPLARVARSSGCCAAERRRRRGYRSMLGDSGGTVLVWGLAAHPGAMFGKLRAYHVSPKGQGQSVGGRRSRSVGPPPSVRLATLSVVSLIDDGRP